MELRDMSHYRSHSNSKSRRAHPIAAAAFHIWHASVLLNESTHDLLNLGHRLRLRRLADGLRDLAGPVERIGEAIKPQAVGTISTHLAALAVDAPAELAS